MRESLFIKKHASKWLEAEKILSEKKVDPEQTRKLYNIVANDYSFARTNFYNRKVRVYLNELNQHLYSYIYKNRKQNFGKALKFWSQDLPLLIHSCKKEMRIALSIFILAIGIGVLSAYKDPGFTRTILGDGYIEQTLKNIENGDPMAIYKSSTQFNMFFNITLNNIMVALRTFVLGIFWAVGTVIIMLYNGIMLGCFQFFFVERGLFAESFLAIWQHGVIEISSIIVAGGAGLVMSKGILFPGTYNRSMSLRMSALKGIKIMASLVPLFILAGFIESFITRQTDLPNSVRIVSILLSSSFILGYFVILPYFAGKKRKAKNDELNENLEKVVEPSKKIFNNEETIRLMLQRTWDTFNAYGWFLVLAPLVYGGLTTLLNIGSIFNMESYKWYHILPTSSWQTLIVLFINTAMVACLNWFSIKFLISKARVKIYGLIVTSLIVAAVSILLTPFDFIGTILIQPFLFSILVLGTKGKSWMQTVTLLFRNLSNLLGPLMITGLLILATTGVIQVLNLYKEFFISWNMVGSELVDYQQLLRFTMQATWLLKWFAIVLVLNNLTYYISQTIYEIDSAEDLLERIDIIGKGKKFKFEK